MQLGDRLTSSQNDVALACARKVSSRLLSLHTRARKALKTLQSGTDTEMY